MSLARVSAVSLKNPAIKTASLLRAIGLPLIPTDFVADFGGVGRAQLSWTAPLDIGVPIEYYDVLINDVATQVAADTTTLNFTSGTKGQTYNFAVSAKGDAGYSPETPVESGTIAGVVASGGSTTTHASGGTTYKVHTFTGNSTFGVTNGGSITGAVKAGGGGGQNIHHAHGQAHGGAGGGFTQNTHTVGTGNLAVTIGGGGGGGSCGCGDCGGGGGGQSKLGTLITANGSNGQSGSTTIATGSTTNFGGNGGTKCCASGGSGHGGSCYGGGGGGGSCTHGGAGCQGVVYVRYIESS